MRNIINRIFNRANPSGYRVPDKPVKVRGRIIHVNPARRLQAVSCPDMREKGSPEVIHLFGGDCAPGAVEGDWVELTYQVIMREGRMMGVWYGAKL